MWLFIIETPKDISLRKSTSFKLSTVKICRGVWPVGELTESATDTHTDRQTDTQTHTHTKVNLYSVHSIGQTKTVLKMTGPSLDAHWESTTSLMHGSCNDDVIQLSPLSFYVVLEVVEISHACFVHLVLQYSLHFSQLDLNLANLEATVKAEWILAFLVLRKRHFRWRHNYVVSCKYWWDILQFFSHMDCQGDLCVRMICAKNCEKLPKYIYNIYKQRSLK